MNKKDDHLDKLMIEIMKDDFDHVPDPLKSKEETWSQISKTIWTKQQVKSPYKLWGTAVTMFALVIIGASFFSATPTTAFGWMKEFFTFQKDSSFYTQSGSKPIDNSNMKPPSADEFVVLEGENKTHNVTVSEAKEMATFNLYVPTYVPDGYTEKKAIVNCFKDECNSIILIYEANDGNPLQIEQQFFEGAYGAGSVVSNVIETKEKKVNGNDATLIITSHKNLKFVKWSNNNIEFTVDGYLSEEEIMKVAESLEFKN
jgi:hypothetical protein